MAYPEKGVKYPGQDKAKALCNRADGGVVDRARNVLRNALTANNVVKQAVGKPVFQDQDMAQAEQISDAVPRRKE